MEQVRAHWRRLYATYMNADAIIADLESCARHLTDGDKWEPNPIADGLKPMEMAKGCACFIAETPDGGLIIPSEPTPGEASDAYETWLNRAKRATIEHWADSLPIRESTRLHCKYLDRDGADYPKEEGDA